MFGITNRCNLTCDFCSRDTSRESAWTVESAALVLKGLAAAGTLEVAFGGGEPFAFRGFRELLSELHSHDVPWRCTSPRTARLLDARSFAPYRGLLGQVRVSIYDDPRWLVAARALSEASKLWGANVLVDDQRLATLPGLLARLASAGMPRRLTAGLCWRRSGPAARSGGPRAPREADCGRSGAESRARCASAIACRRPPLPTAARARAIAAPARTS